MGINANRVGLNAKPCLCFVHEGRAAYPEIAAYRASFENEFDCVERTPSEAAQLPFDRPTILWHMMGFYPADLSAGRAKIIHDYRSLSVGALARVKDKIKRWRNARPALRIFQNEAMRAAMGFDDAVPSLLLPMGVPSFCKKDQAEKRIDFCYCGAMSAERKTHEMLDSFWRRFGAGKRFFLFGEPEAFLPKRYAGKPSIVFAGKVPQAELFQKMAEARCAVNYFPNHFPHLVQTPTKLLEYAALGLRILANEHPASRETAACYGIQALWGPARDMFRAVPEALDWPDNAGLDPSPFLWPSVIEASGVRAVLRAWGEGT